MTHTSRVTLGGYAEIAHGTTLVTEAKSNATDCGRCLRDFIFWFFESTGARGQIVKYCLTNNTFPLAGAII